MLYGHTKNWRPKKWTVESALLYSAQRVEDNEDGAKRLAVWALEKEKLKKEKK